MKRLSLALLLLAACSPASNQLAASLGITAGEAACVVLARCNGVADVADFCRVTADALRRYESAQHEDPSCPIPDAGGQ